MNDARTKSLHIKTAYILLIGLTVCLTLEPSVHGRSFPLGDHPVTTSQDPTAPPGFGLQLDNLFLQTAASGTHDRVAASGGTTTFSFDHPSANMKLDATDTSGIHITGTVYGGVVFGDQYSFGEGLYTIDFWYQENVSGNETDGWTIPLGLFSNLNQGSITKLGDSNDVKDGTSWTFFMAADISDGFGTELFEFAPDGYLMEKGIDTHHWVGRGGLTFNDDGSDFVGKQGFLFVPLPPAMWTGLIMLSALCLLASIRHSWIAKG